MNRPLRRPAALALVALLAACATAPTEGARTTSAADPVSEAPTARSTDDAKSPPAATADATPGQTAAEDALLAAVLTDVRSGEAFTLGQLAADGPVLVEPMAVWCTSCRAQQQEVRRAHERVSFASVSLDVDLSETAGDLAAYADREGFAWHFAMADAELYRLLQERFGVAATNPPSTPLIVVDPDLTVRPLEFGRGTRSAEQLVAELEAG